MSDWKIIVPEATLNKFADPSFALPDPDTMWVIQGDGAVPDVVRHTDDRLYGFSCAEYDLSGGTYVILYQSFILTANTWTLSARVKRSGGGLVTNTQCRGMFRSSYMDWDSITHIGDGWYLCELEYPGSIGNTSYGVLGKEDGLLVDGVQLEEKSYPTTYCDGEQEGCYWTGVAHESSSVRSAATRAGGRIMDLKDDYGFRIAEVIGAGAVNRKYNIDDYAVLPGGKLNQLYKPSKSFTLVGTLHRANQSIHATRKALLDVLSEDAVPLIDGEPQPVRLIYEGAPTSKVLQATYVSGLDGNWDLNTTVHKIQEKVAIRFAQANPLNEGLGDSDTVLDTADSVTIRYITSRIRDNGQWSNLGLTANPTGSELYVAIWDIKYNHVNGLIYVAGDFQGWNGNSGWNYIVSYNPLTGAWANVGPTSSVNHRIQAMAIAANGDVYVGGYFTDLGGANGDYVAYYDISAGAWTPVAAGGTGSVHALFFDSVGRLYIGGDFTNWATITYGDYVVVWNGTSYEDLGDGVNQIVHHFAEDVNGDIILGGRFTADGTSTTTMYYVGRFNWLSGLYYPMDRGFDDYVLGLTYNPYTGEIIATGQFEQDSTLTYDYNGIAIWNGTKWRDVGGGWDTGSAIFRSAISPIGDIYVVGEFQQIGGLQVSDSIAMWNGSCWTHLDIDLPGTSVNPLSLCLYEPDVVLPNKFSIMIGMGAAAASGTAQFCGVTTVENAGTSLQYPVVKIKRTGGTGAWLLSLRQETTGKYLYMYHKLLDGEEITIDFRPGQRSIKSDSQGDIWQAILPNSDFSQFYFLPGDNLISMYVKTSGSPTIDCIASFKAGFDGVD